MFLDHYFEPNNDPKISYILPINRTIKVIFYTLSGEKLGEPDYFNPCLQSNTNATLDYAKFNDINVQIDVQGKCPGKSTTVFPNGTFVINEILSNGKLGRTMITVVKKGKGTLILKDNTKYRMRVTYDKKIKTTEFTFNKSGMSLPSNQGLTGTVTYDARTKTTLLKAQFTIPDCN